ncbi:hypothetical protein ABZY09_45435 [Streptomyces sp. NPDC002928]|uniref:hypothetical protein n=1 Tax=Streptomyces sp. NPDC002928 TaxID=3154440 RepID=UPI0033A3A56E
MPSVSTLQLAREKKEWVRSCGQERARPAPVSIPVTVPAPVCATNPVTIAVKVSKLGAVNTRSVSNTASREAGTGGLGSIDGSLPGVVATPLMLPPSGLRTARTSRPVTRPG